MIRLRSHRTGAALALSLLVAACGRAGGDIADSDGAGAPPPAAALSGEGEVSLEKRLERLDADLGLILQRGLDEEANARLLAAEAMTDRLLEDEPDAAWLATGYLVEARLRQIQALSDRIIAELGRGVQKELILEDVAGLRLAVRDLRSQLHGQGNGDAPPPLDSLLAASINDRIGLGGVPATSGSTSSDTGSTTAPAEPRAAPEGGPLGEPIQP